MRKLNIFKFLLCWWSNSHQYHFNYPTGDIADNTRFCKKCGHITTTKEMLSGKGRF